MNPSEIVKKLRALALEIEQGTTTTVVPRDTRPARAPLPETRPAHPELRTVEIEVGYWKVADTKTGKPMGSLSPANDGGERVFWKVFDEKLILSVDPLQRGERLRCSIKPWNDTFVVERIERLDSQVARSGITKDEIPF